MNLFYRSTKFLILYFSLSFAQEVYICVWRNPELTMQKIFPKAKDYKTVTKKISNEKREHIEKRLGSKLLPGQREQFQYYEIIDSSNNILGYILAGSQKGEYGAIEFVFGLDENKKIVGIYIQRAREKDKEFKKKEFLNQFIGKTIQDEQNLENLIEAKKTYAVSSVILGVRKELIAFDELVLKQDK